VLLVVLTGGLNLLWTSREVHGLRTAVLASCAFAADLGGAPVTTQPGIRPSRLGISIVADSRAQWHHLGCPGRLAPPAPSFVKWARFYHLEAS
jgi:hypothetical protein